MRTFLLYMAYAQSPHTTECAENLRFGPLLFPHCRRGEITVESLYLCVANNRGAPIRTSLQPLTSGPTAGTPSASSPQANDFGTVEKLVLISSYTFKSMGFLQTSMVRLDLALIKCEEETVKFLVLVSNAIVPESNLLSKNLK